jgi:hypothetical protein
MSKLITEVLQGDSHIKFKIFLRFYAATVSFASRKIWRDVLGHNRAVIALRPQSKTAAAFCGCGGFV